MLPSYCIIICLFFIFCTWRRQFSVESACVSLFRCTSSYRGIHFPGSVLSVLSSSPVVVHSFLRKRTFFFFSHSWIARVVVLYTSLRFVYKPQRACVGWASVTESCLEAFMWIKRTRLDEFPPGWPRLQSRVLHQSHDFPGSDVSLGSQCSCHLRFFSKLCMRVVNKNG